MKQIDTQLLGEPTGEIPYKFTHIINYLVYSTGSTPNVMLSAINTCVPLVPDQNNKKLCGYKKLCGFEYHKW